MGVEVGVGLIRKVFIDKEAWHKVTSVRLGLRISVSSASTDRVPSA